MLALDCGTFDRLAACKKSEVIYGYREAMESYGVVCKVILGNIDWRLWGHWFLAVRSPIII